MHNVYHNYCIRFKIYSSYNACIQMVLERFCIFISFLFSFKFVLKMMDEISIFITSLNCLLCHWSWIFFANDNWAKNGVVQPRPSFDHINKYKYVSFCFFALDIEILVEICCLYFLCNICYSPCKFYNWFVYLYR